MEKGSCCQGDAQVRRLKRSPLTLPKARLSRRSVDRSGRESLKYKQSPYIVTAKVDIFSLPGRPSRINPHSSIAVFLS